ncbi:MAG: response regulator [Bacteroidia bacterium]
MIKQAPSYSVFIADDDKDDQMFICSAFEELGIDIVLKTFENGKLLLDYFVKNKIDPESKGCNFVLLDLNMPVLDGMQTLRRLRTTRELDTLPVVILSTSNRAKDVDAAFQYMANGYICKPLKCSDYKMIAGTLVKFWSGHYQPENSPIIKFLRKDLSSIPHTI